MVSLLALLTPDCSCSDHFLGQTFLSFIAGAVLSSANFAGDCERLRASLPQAGTTRYAPPFASIRPDLREGRASVMRLVPSLRTAAF